MATESEKVRVIGISGSLRPGSYTTMAVQLALEGAAEAGAQTQLLDLRDYQLAFCDGNDDETKYPPDVFRLRRDVKSASGIILGTPEYHGSFSGVLKNALDLLSFDELEGKMIGLIGVSAGAMGGFSALEGLQAVGRALHAWVVPELAAVAQDYSAFTAEGRLKDPKLEQRVKKVGREVTRFASLHCSDHSRQFLKEWETALTNPGAA